MPALTTEYSGIALYFSKATSQSASLSGGMAPSSGCHSVIDSPLSVRRTAPPTTIMQKTSAATASSQICTAASAARTERASSCVAEMAKARVPYSTPRG